jgi:hypothetical protein
MKVNLIVTPRKIQNNLQWLVSHGLQLHWKKDLQPTKKLRHIYLPNNLVNISPLTAEDIFDKEVSAVKHPANLLIGAYLHSCEGVCCPQPVLVGLASSLTTKTQRNSITSIESIGKMWYCHLLGSIQWENTTRKNSLNRLHRILSDDPNSST